MNHADSAGNWLRRGEGGKGLRSCEMPNGAPSVAQTEAPVPSPGYQCRSEHCVEIQAIESGRGLASRRHYALPTASRLWTMKVALNMADALLDVTN